MSLPPDPHDDDLTQPEPAPAAAVPPPPPPPPPPPAPAPDIAPLASAAAALGRDLGRPAAAPPTAGSADPVGVPPDPAWTPERGAGWPAGPPVAGRADERGRDPLTGAAAPDGRPLTPPPVGTARRGRGRLLAAVGAVVLVVAVVGGVALAGGGDDDETSGPVAERDDAGADEVGADAAADGPAGDAADAPAGSTPSPGDEPTAGDDPVAVAAAMFTAATQGDCAGVVRHMTPEAYGPNGETEQQAIASCAADADGSELRDAELVDAVLVSESGATAVVAVTVALDGEQRSRDVPMERVDGEWKVAIVAG